MIPMVFKCGPIELIYSLSIVLAELELIEIKIEIRNIQIVANDFNGFTNLCFRNVCKILFVIFRVFLHL